MLTAPSYQTSFKEDIATSSPGTPLERDDVQECLFGGLQYVGPGLSARPLWIREFYLQTPKNKEPASGLEPLTSSHYE
jgi:hypothetical protein